MAGIEIRDLVVEYSTGEYAVRPLDGLDLDAGDGELVVLLGPSGAGKTTLLSCIAGILTPTSGSVRVGGREVTTLSAPELVRHRRKSVGIVFQGFNLIASLSARDNVVVPLLLTGARGGDARRRADELLALVDLTHRASHRPNGLSGGQQQRVAIARALAHDPPVLLADEPTAHLDHVQVETVVSLLRRLAAPGRSVLVSTHDDRLLPLADRVVELSPKAVEPLTGPERRQLPAGQVLFTQGSPSDYVYVVEEGAVEIYRTRPDGTEQHLTVVYEGYFGEMGPMLGLPRSASARTVVSTTVVAYAPRDFRNLQGTTERRRYREGSGTA